MCASSVVLNMFRISKIIPSCFSNSSGDNAKEVICCKTV